MTMEPLVPEETKALLRQLNAEVADLAVDVTALRVATETNRKAVEINQVATTQNRKKLIRARIENAVLAFAIVVSITFGALYVHDAYQRRAQTRQLIQQNRQQIDQNHKDVRDLACLAVSRLPNTSPTIRDLRVKYRCPAYVPPH